MAYRNVELPWGQERTFVVPGWGERKPGNLTIDEEKDYVLFEGVVDKDRPDEKPFYFYFKGEIVSLLLNGDEYVNDNTVKWKLLDINIPGSLDRGEVFEELRKALKVYGVNGWSKEIQEVWKRDGYKDPNGFAIADF